MMTFDSTLVFQVTLLKLVSISTTGSDNTENRPSTDVKCGPSHKLQLIEEIILVLVLLTFNILEKDLGD